LNPNMQNLNDGELGTKVFKVLLTLNKQMLHSFMASQNIIGNLGNIETMCDHLDRLNSKQCLRQTTQTMDKQ